MKRTAIIFLVLAMLVGVFTVTASADAYIGTPTQFKALYNLKAQTITYSGTYTGVIQPSRTYMIVLVDADGTLISARNPSGSELDKGNGRFEVTYTLGASVATEYKQPFQATLRCMTASVLAPISTTVTVTSGEMVSVSFVAGDNGTIFLSSSLSVEKNTPVSDITFPGVFANANYEFDKWTADSGVKDGVIVADTVFTATFKKKLLLGDANGDGTINSIDAALILKYDSGANVTLDEAAADVNGDGAVNSIDAALILKYDSGAIEKF